MKLNMTAAWNSAVTMLNANRSVVTIIGGVFFFLPYLALILLLPGAIEPQVQADPPNLEALVQAIRTMYAENWWAILLMSIVQGIGGLALLALLTDKARPTVGEALQRGAIGLVPYLVAQLVAAVSIGLAIGIPISVATAIGSPALTLVAWLFAFIALLYAIVKISLVAQVVAIDRILNPIAVLKRSWSLTKGNSGRLLLFYMLLAIALGIVLLVITMVMGLLFAAFGGQIELIGNGIVTSATNAVFAIIGLSVLAAVHRQLAGPGADLAYEPLE